MKLLLLTLLVALSSAKKYTVSEATVNSWESIIEPHVEKCKQKTEVKQAHIERMKYFEYPEEEEFMCFMDCLYTALDVIDSNGEVDTEEIEKLFGLSSKHAEKCKDKVESKGNSCKKAYKLLNCIVKEKSKEEEKSS